MNVIRLAGTALAIGLSSISSAVGATPSPPGISAGANSVAAELAATGLTDSMFPPPRPATIVQSMQPASLPIVMADVVAAGGADVIGAGRRYGGRVTGSLRLSIAPSLAVETRTGLLTLDRGEAHDRRRVRSGARLRLGGPTHGAWAGVALERSLAGARLPATVQLGLGAWASPGRMALAFSLEQTNEHARIATVLPPETVPDERADTIAVPLRTVFDDRLVRSTSALVSGRWEHRRIGVESVAGVTLNRRFAARRWMQTSFDVALRPRLSLYATLGSPAPRWFALEPGLARNASLGLRLTSAVNADASEADEVGARAPEFRLRHLGEDWYVIEVRAKAAGPVEVIGDFSAWEPRALRHVTGARWALAMKLEPGVHQIQVRVDGGLWSPPAGLPAASDGFNGAVGVFIAS